MLGHSALAVLARHKQGAHSLVRSLDGVRDAPLYTELEQSLRCGRSRHYTWASICLLSAFCAAVLGSAVFKCAHCLLDGLAQAHSGQRERWHLDAVLCRKCLHGGSSTFRRCLQVFCTEPNSLRRLSARYSEHFMCSCVHCLSVVVQR